MRTLTRSAAVAATALGAGALLALAAPIAAQADVIVEPDTTSAGSSAVLDFTSGHGCDGSPTTSFTVDIPEEVLSVTPTFQAGWTIEKVMVELDEPIEDAHGETVSDRVGQVVFTAGTPIPEGYRAAFQLQALLPQGAVGDRVEFPVLQTCVEGETSWSDSPGADGEEGDNPVPAIELTEAVAGGDGHGEAAADDHGADGAEGTDEADAVSDASADDSVDVLARVIGIAGLAVGVAGLIVAIAARRGSKA